MENIKDAINSLSDQTKKINIALYYVNNDMEKAKKMVANSYQDMNVIKGNFSSSSLYGAFLIFLNTVYGRVDHFIFVVSRDYAVGNIAVTNDWRPIEKEILELRNISANNAISMDFDDRISKGFTPSFVKDINEQIKKNDITQFINSFQKLFQMATDLKRVDISVELQTTTSLQMELESITSRKVSADIAMRKKEEKAASEATQSTDVDQDPKSGVNGVKLVVMSTLILSPIKGKHISNILPGDKVMITMVENSSQVMEIATAFNAVSKDDKRILPIPARVTSVKYFDGVGYQIYAIIAKGIYAKIMEEETNIKIALDPSSESAVVNETEGKGKIFMPMVIGLVTLIVILLVIILTILL